MQEHQLVLDLFGLCMLPPGLRLDLGDFLTQPRHVVCKCVPPRTPAGQARHGQQAGYQFTYLGHNYASMIVFFGGLVKLRSWLFPHDFHYLGF
jgi:hypothetical protein